MLFRSVLSLPHLEQCLVISGRFKKLAERIIEGVSLPLFLPCLCVCVSMALSPPVFHFVSVPLVCLSLLVFQCLLVCLGLSFPLCASLAWSVVGASPLPRTRHHPPTSMGTRHSCGDLLVPSAFSACTQMPMFWYSCRCLRGMEQWFCPSLGTQSGIESSWV